MNTAAKRENVNSECIKSVLFNVISLIMKVESTRPDYKEEKQPFGVKELAACLNIRPESSAKRVFQKKPHCNDEEKSFFSSEMRRILNRE